MRAYLFFVILALFLSACSQNSGNGRNNDRYEKKIRKEVLTIAENYATNNLTDAKKTVMENGITTIGNDQKMYVIDPAKIFFGYIDSDTKNDAIVSLCPYQGQYEITTEHLIIIQTDGRLILIRSLESDMRILGIKDGIITAEVPEYSRNSPLFNCPSCWEVVKFQFIKGELIKTDLTTE